MTVTEFCKECKISQVTYYKIINTGKSNIMSVFRIAGRMNIPVKELLKTEEDGK